jgi:hypothetical protein
MFPESGEYHGFDGLRRFTENQAEAFEEISVEPTEFIDAGQHVRSASAERLGIRAFTRPSR